MGLRITYDCFDGPYGVFSRFRQSLAFQIGIDLKDYAGYDEGGTKDLKSIDHELMHLFNHSDCDGYLTQKQNKQVLIGLKKVKENFNPDLPQDYDLLDRVNQFIEGLENAIAEGKRVYFR